MILVLSGTKDGKEIAERLKLSGFEVIASTVTDYGASLFDKGIKVFSGVLDEVGMIDFINKNKINIVVDATHPFAKEVSINAINASLRASIKYIRYERQSADFRNAILAADFDEAVEKCKEFDNIFLTIGSKNLEKFRPLWEDGKKVTARVLPSSDVLIKCEGLGLTPKDIIAMEGPFSTELNYIMFKERKAEVIVTKESGTTGGVAEKLEAASRLGICTILIKRPIINYPTIVNDFDSLMKEIIDNT
ncbi:MULTISPECIES: precorrin-6A reductase [Thermoanaerobacterium]|uniref:Precorrin-6x reductase n=2 Tax=Thermoanaerobacterium TaxID=28895 RepID=W9E7N4_9THEO|nr:MULTISPECIES: precorrin-6A reductase [Thermoanaerobacterium]AFK87633.1 precorrin-6x reductase [Thermoanaerobacterium saccharolyticum JW/SL-YS485]ETO37568.1 precorrin-6x reductase [Thermoanaerobacterium aotearoense SCUT27]